jgi:hypothetical protein
LTHKFELRFLRRETTEKIATESPQELAAYFNFFNIIVWTEKKELKITQ